MTDAATNQPTLEKGKNVHVLLYRKTHQGSRVVEARRYEHAVWWPESTEPVNVAGSCSRSPLSRLSSARHSLFFAETAAAPCFWGTRAYVRVASCCHHPLGSLTKLPLDGTKVVNVKWFTTATNQCILYLITSASVVVPPSAHAMLNLNSQILQAARDWTYADNRA